MLGKKKASVTRFILIDKDITDMFSRDDTRFVYRRRSKYYYDYHCVCNWFIKIQVYTPTTRPPSQVSQFKQQTFNYTTTLSVTGKWLLWTRNRLLYLISRVAFHIVISIKYQLIYLSTSCCKWLPPAIRENIIWNAFYRIIN